MSTTLEFVPREYQDMMVAHMLERPRCALWAGMGMGKTVATLSAIQTLAMVTTGPALVLAPKRVARNVWPAELRKWAHLSGMTLSPIIGNVAERRAAMRKRADVYAINYDNLVWLVEEHSRRWPYRTVIADESTRLKNFRLRKGGRRARALGSVAHKSTERFIELTGTPAPNGLLDLWGQAWFIDKGERLGRSFDAYRSRYFRPTRTGDDPYAVTWQPLPYAQAQIEDKLRDVCLSLDARDWFDLYEPIVNVIRVPLPSRARALYESMEDELFLELECGTQVEAFNAASKTTKCLQLANGAIYTDEARTRWTEVHDEKLQALEDVIEEAAGTPVLVAYHFRSDLARLLKAFPQGRALDDDPQTEDDWNAGKIPVLFAHPQSAGHGLNLQEGGNIIAVFGHWWDLEAFQQMVERIGPTRQHQSGHDRPVFIHHIIAADTIDEVVLQRRESKRSVQALLLAAMKDRRQGAAP